MGYLFLTHSHMTHDLDKKIFRSSWRSATRSTPFEGTDLAHPNIVIAGISQSGANVSYKTMGRVKQKKLQHSLTIVLLS